MRDNMHDWVVANENMARRCWRPRVIITSLSLPATPGTQDSRVKQQTLPEALEWLWQDYQPDIK
jgi:iron(III)-enterobactin esterase